MVIIVRSLNEYDMIHAQAKFQAETILIVEHDGTVRVEKSRHSSPDKGPEAALAHTNVLQALAKIYYNQTRTILES